MFLYEHFLELVVFLRTVLSTVKWQINFELSAFDRNGFSFLILLTCVAVVDDGYSCCMKRLKTRHQIRGTPEDGKTDFIETSFIVGRNGHFHYLTICTFSTRPNGRSFITSS